MTEHELQLKSVRLRRDSKPLEFERFGNYGEFAIIKKSGGHVGLDFNPVEFDGIRILKGDSDFKGLEFETFSSLNSVVSHN